MRRALLLPLPPAERTPCGGRLAVLPPPPRRGRVGEGVTVPMRILIFADQADWHVRALKEGFAAAGAAAEAVSLRRCGLRMTGEGARFLLPEPCATPPDLAFV